MEYQTNICIAFCYYITFLWEKIVIVGLIKCDQVWYVLCGRAVSRDL